MKKMLLILAVAGVLAGCASMDSERLDAWSAHEQARQARMDVLAAQCETDLCLVMVAQEAGQGTPIPRKDYHPAWNIFGNVLNAAVPAYFGYRQQGQWVDAITGVSQTIAEMDNRYTDNSVSVGGDQIGRDRIDDRSVGGDQVGGDQRIGDETNIGRDQIGGDQRLGDDIDGSCVGADCRNNSDGPIDQSDHSDNSDNSDSTTAPDDEEEGGDP